MGSGIVMVDAAALRQRAILEDSGMTRYSVSFTGDGRHILSGGAGGWIWSAESGRLVGRISAGDSEEVPWVDMSPGREYAPACG